MQSRAVLSRSFGVAAATALALSLVVTVLAVVTPAAEASTTAVPVRFASYNIRTSTLYNGAWGDHDTRWDGDDAGRMRRAADTMAANGVTAVATQEMRSEERGVMLRRLARQTGHRWGWTALPTRRDGTNVLFDKAVWWKVREVHFQIPFPPRKPRNQVGVLLKHRQTKQRVWFYSVHYPLGKTEARKEARRKGARRTLEVIRNQSNGHPYVLGGDFNEEAGGAAFRIFARADFIKNARAAADRRVKNHCKTWNGRAGSAGRQSCLSRPAPHIDHIWVTRRATWVHRFKVMASTRTSRSSDHNPIGAFLRTRY